MMTTEQTRKFIQEYFTDINQDKSEKTIDRYVADEHLKAHIIVFETGLPGYQLIPQDVIIEGNKATIRFVVEAEHTGELFGIAPTGRPVRVEGIIIYEVASDKIVNHWMQVDSVALMQQIGAAPVGATPVGATPVGATPVGAAPAGAGER